MPNKNNPKNIIVHHSVTPRDLAVHQTENSIERNHTSRGFPISSLGWHIGYQYVIYGNGEIRQYRRDDDIGAHTKETGMNFESLGVCLIGDFDKELPSAAQIQTLIKFLREKIAQYSIDPRRIYPHRKFATYKSCYGSRLPDDWAAKLINMPTAHELDVTKFISKDGVTLGYAIKLPTPEAFAAVETLIATYGAKIKPQVPSSEL